jgi:hypothetical protein
VTRSLQVQGIHEAVLNVILIYQCILHVVINSVYPRTDYSLVTHIHIILIIRIDEVVLSLRLNPLFMVVLSKRDVVPSLIVIEIGR